MWGALTPAKFERFPHLQSLLRYLKMCAHSALFDLVRAAERAGVVTELDRVELIGETSAPSVESQVLDRVQRHALWQEIEARLKNDKERTAIYGLYLLGLKPRELYAQHPDCYRVRENVIARLRRDDE
jgi:DNA-directed RNA polymerase specialized sigma24 family protein